MSPHDAPMIPEGPTGLNGSRITVDSHPTRDVDDHRHLLGQLRRGEVEPETAAAVLRIVRDDLLGTDLGRVFVHALDEGGYAARDVDEPETDDEWMARYAMPTRAIVLALSQCPSCLTLYVWLDVEIGGKPAWTRTITRAAKQLGWQTRRVTTHAEHLAARRIVTLSRHGENASQRMRLRYQPARQLGLGDVDLSRIPTGARSSRRGARSSRTTPTGARSSRTTGDRALTIGRGL
jgi:hypothetical protein